MTEPTDIRTRVKRAIATHAIAFGLGALLFFALVPTPEPRIEFREKEKLVEVVNEKEVAKWKSLYEEERERTSKTKVVTRTITVEKPTGEKVTTTDKTETNDTTEKVDIDLVKEGERVVEKIVEREVTRDVYIKQEPVLPQWMLTGMVGVDNIPSLPPSVIYGGMVQRRVVGNVWAGAWGTSAPNAGLALSVEF